MNITLETKRTPSIKEIDGAIVYLINEISLNQIQLRLGRFTGVDKGIMEGHIVRQQTKLVKLYKAKSYERE